MPICDSYKALNICCAILVTEIASEEKEELLKEVPNHVHICILFILCYVQISNYDNPRIVALLRPLRMKS